MENLDKLSLRNKVLLSFQGALLGEIFPSLRAIAVEWTDVSVKFWAYIDGPLDSKDEDSLSSISASVAADFDDMEIDWEFSQLNAPTPIPGEKLRVYSRREY